MHVHNNKRIQLRATLISENIRFTNCTAFVKIDLLQNHIIYNAMMATINPNDEVIIPAPFWVSYPDIVLLAEGKPVIVECSADQQFKITANQLEKNITKNT